MKDDVIKANDNWHENGIAIPAAELPLVKKDGSTVFFIKSNGTEFTTILPIK